MTFNQWGGSATVKISTYCGELDLVRVFVGLEFSVIGGTQRGTIVLLGRNSQAAALFFFFIGRFL